MNIMIINIMKFYRFILINGEDFSTKYTCYDDSVYTTTTACANKLTDYLHYLFSKKEFLPLYNLYEIDGEYGPITYDDQEKILHMPNFYEYTLERFKECVEDNFKGSYRFDIKALIEMLNKDDKYTLNEAGKMIEFCIDQYIELDSYGSDLRLIKEPYVECNAQ